MKCQKCGSENIEPFITAPERKEGTPVGKCKQCGTILKTGKSIF
jgi:uncharacterized Zn finger protein